MDVQSIKNRFGIIGNSPALNHALNVATQVAVTDLSVLIVGESGVGKEVFSQIIHALSARKHNSFIAVNCGAIPEGTIDSELFGHEKGAFTGAVDSRKGYFETVNGGTIFLDEIGEMPLGTQARLLRVLETGEFIRVGSSKVQKTDVRVIAATNRELLEFTQNGRFREDLYYRLSTVPIRVPALKDRKEDVPLLFRKFVVDFAERYKTNPVQLDDEARNMLLNYPWPGNVRELKNIAEQISVLSKQPVLNATELRRFLPDKMPNRLPVLASVAGGAEFSNEREILYKLFFDMKKDVTELKKMFLEILQNPSMAGNMATYTKESLMNDYAAGHSHMNEQPTTVLQTPAIQNTVPQNTILPNTAGHAVILPHDHHDDEIHHHEEVEESLNILDKEKELIIKALKKHKGKRKDAALDLGISERTLYRKLKEYNIEDL
ncbi:transcriptional regulator [Filimonas lacunae]|uniref:Transcriptional regulator n=1 Tax=Filimonas lacunae TaxID=477680 RepID=A0A173MIW8_9BACT|nr:sigma-54 dependent transcriptional regulator [Filimonas lacunae]BAV07593.1 transcriptional regulator, sigma-54-related [Filimonas lacunae]SIT29848.1 transcriptional regulator [Filimonas lacunae]